MSEMVNHPQHYNSHPSGVEVIEIVRHMGFNLGNSVKYLMRLYEKGNPLQDAKKALWYLEDEMMAGKLGGTAVDPAKPEWTGATKMVLFHEADPHVKAALNYILSASVTGEMVFANLAIDQMKKLITKLQGV